MRLLFALWLNLRSEQLSIFFPYAKPGNLENRAREGRRWDCFVHHPKQLKGRAGELFVRLFSLKGGVNSDGGDDKGIITVQKKTQSFLLQLGWH